MKFYISHMKLYGLLILLFWLSFANGQSDTIYQNLSQKDTVLIKKKISKLLLDGESLAQKDKFDSALDSVSIAEQLALDLFGPVSQYYARCLNIRGLIKLYASDYAGAEKAWIETKSIRAISLGVKHSDYCASLINLGIVYFLMGRYEEAEFYYLEAKSIFEGQDNYQSDAWYMNCLVNLGGLYYKMGNNEKAERFYLQTLKLREKKFGKTYPEYTATLFNLTGIYLEWNHFEKAESLLLEALNIIKSAVGEDNSNFAGGLGNFGLLYKKTNQPNKADSIYNKALKIVERSVGKEHPDYANILVELGLLNIEQKKFTQAEQNILAAKSIREKVFGKEHLDYLFTLEHLTTIYKEEGNFKKAEGILLELSTLSRQLLQKALAHLSERELSQYVEMFTKIQSQTLYFAQATENQKLIAVCYDNSLFYKGFLLTAANQIKRLDESNPQVSEKSKQLQAYGRRLAAEYSNPLSDRDSARIVELEEKVNLLEKELNRLVAGYSHVKLQVNWQDIHSKLKPGEAAIEFVQYSLTSEKNEDSILYAALIIRQDKLYPVIINLFEQHSLDAVFSSQGARKADYVNQMYSLVHRGAKELGSENKNLYELIWKPIQSELDGIQTIYLSPTGLLHRMNISAIPLNPDEILADRYRIITLNSTRQLVIQSSTDYPENDAMIYGGLIFDQDSTKQSIDGTYASRSTPALSISSTDPNLRGGNWEFLPGTEKEINLIHQILKTSGFRVTKISGNDGTEFSFKSLGTKSKSPNLLHLATHGYFFPDRTNSTNSNVSHHPDDSIRNLSSQKHDRMENTTLDNKMNEESVFKISEHPMLRSGLILSGGNAGWKGKRSLVDGEDGVLTAYEISQMNLSNTELVVLSACETGLGDIQGNEGVYGLQRAFKIAGVKYIIMSLWQVPDKQTSMLMTTFYKKWLEAKDPVTGKNNMSIPDAFYAAQKELRDNGFDPYQWAGFVLVE